LGIFAAQYAVSDWRSRGLVVIAAGVIAFPRRHAYRVHALSTLVCRTRTRFSQGGCEEKGAPMAAEIVTDLPTARRSLTRAKKSGRSRITNGKAFVLGTDGRNPWIRRCKDIAAAHTSDLGGESAISEAQRSLIRRISILTVQSEMLESKFAQAHGDASAKDLDLYIRASGNLRRLLQTIGLERRARDVGPSLGDLIKLDQERQRQQLAHEREARRGE
jgi:hypothetical protein